MDYFLYISDIFCPWCYGFSQNIQQIKKHFKLPFKVYSGALIEPATTLENRVKNVSDLSTFIEKMYKITNIRISKEYEKLAQSEQAKNIILDSRKASHLFYTLKNFVPEQALEIMEYLQFNFYGLGQDIFTDTIITNFAQTHNINPQEIFNFYNTSESENASYLETEKSFEILGDVILYPTLYLVKNETYNFISRGYVSFDECKNKIDELLNQDNIDSNSSGILGKSCSLDGICE